MTELELRLSALREEVAWPQTPSLEVTVEQRPLRRSLLRPLALGLALLLVVLAGVLALSPGARSAFLELFRIRGATVERVEKLPEVDLQRFDLGQPVSRADAERRVGFSVVDLGEPDGFYVNGRVASLLYGSIRKPRLVLTELQGSVWTGLIKKVGASGTRVDDVIVNGEQGLFISGDQHFVMFLDANGSVVDERTYLAGTVLLWNHGPLLLRLEGDLTRDEAVRLAASVG
jgi:hypothetical protein